MKVTFLVAPGDKVYVSEFHGTGDVYVEVEGKDTFANFTLTTEEKFTVTRFDIPGGETLIVVETPAETPEPEIDRAEWGSLCCGVGPAEGTEVRETTATTPVGAYGVGFCGACHDSAGFERYA